MSTPSLAVAKPMQPRPISPFRTTHNWLPEVPTFSLKHEEEPHVGKRKREPSGLFWAAKSRKSFVKKLSDVHDEIPSVPDPQPQGVFDDDHLPANGPVPILELSKIPGALCIGPSIYFEEEDYHEQPFPYELFTGRLVSDHPDAEAGCHGDRCSTPMDTTCFGCFDVDDSEFFDSPVLR